MPFLVLYNTFTVYQTQQIIGQCSNTLWQIWCNVNWWKILLTWTKVFLDLVQVGGSRTKVLGSGCSSVLCSPSSRRWRQPGCRGAKFLLTGGQLLTGVGNIDAEYFQGYGPPFLPIFIPQFWAADVKMDSSQTQYYSGARSWDHCVSSYMVGNLDNGLLGISMVGVTR